MLRNEELRMFSWFQTKKSTKHLSKDKLDVVYYMKLHATQIRNSALLRKTQIKTVIIHTPFMFNPRKFKENLSFLNT